MYLINICKVCGCTDENCVPCIQRTGEPSYWVDDNRDLCSACLDYWCAKMLLDNFEWFDKKYGLCNLISILYFDKKIITKHESALIRDWIYEAKPPVKYHGKITSVIMYPWKIGDIDSRWYWLKSKLKEFKNE